MKPFSWERFYRRFKDFEKNEYLAIEIKNTHECREYLEKLGYLESPTLDKSKIGKFFAIDKEDGSSSYIIFHKLPINFNWKNKRSFVEIWFSIYSSYVNEIFREIISNEDSEEINEKESKSSEPFYKTISKLNELIEEQTYSWDSFYKEFKGEFDKEYSLGIELFDSEEVRDKLDNLGYKINTSNLLDISKIGEYFPTVSDQSEESVIMIFHKLPLDFDYDEGNNFVKKWFGLNKKSIRSLDPFFMQDESSEDQSFEKLQNLKEFTKNWFESESQEWLKFIVEKTKERTFGHYEAEPDSFWWNPKKVEDWEYECAAALTASCINEYELKGKEFVTEMLAELFAETNLIGEGQSTKIQMLLLHSSMIGFESYFLNDCKLGGNESIKLTDEIVLKAFNIDLN